MHSGESTFSLCLTHDLDRPYKTYQAVYDAVRHRDPGMLRTLVDETNPYWQFETIMDVERDHGVRSAFYVLNEPSLLAYDRQDWLDPANWVEHFGRYDPTAPDVIDALGRLAAGGWEIGLHGSRKAASDPDRLAVEQATLNGLLDDRVVGCRHHHLTLDAPATWRAHVDAGLAYDATLGTLEPGFQHGYGLRQPFDDDFVVFPLTIMEIGLPDPGDDFAAARAECERLLDEAAANGAVMTVLWHPRYFNESDFPGYRRLYDWLLGAAADRGAWIGSPAEFLYRRADPAAPAARDAGPLATPADTEVH